MELGAYYEKISKEPLLTKEEETDLFLEMKDPSIPESRRKSIQDRIIRTGLRFVFREAKRRSQNNPFIFEELIAAGNDGLLVGMEKFELEKGYRFLTYAGWWVKQRMLNVLGKQRIVSLPIWRQQLSAKIERAIEADEDITIDELKALFPEVPPKDIEELFETRFLTFYIDDMPEESEFQINPIEEEVERRLDNEKIYNAVDSLPEPHRTIINYSFGLIDGDDKRKPSDISKELKISRERLVHLKREALDMLRTKFGGVNPF